MHTDGGHHTDREGGDNHETAEDIQPRRPRQARDLVRLVDDDMEGVAREHRKRLESTESELADVRRWLDRLYRAIETTDLDVSDIAPRIREHRERELQESAREVEATLAERRVTVDNLETITAFAGDMSTYLSEAVNRAPGFHPVVCQGDFSRPRESDHSLQHPDA